jgi:hypothetical protein
MAGNEFYKQLAIFSEKLEKSQSQRRKTRIDHGHLQEERAEEGLGRNIALSPDVASLFGYVRQHLAREKNCYTLPRATIPINPESAVPAEADATVETPVPLLAPSAFLQELHQKLMPLLQPVVPPADLPVNLDPRVRAYATLFAEELQTHSNDPSLLGHTGATIMPRLKQAQQAIYMDRMQDALTLLRTAYKAHPHSHLLLYLLSQFLYLMHTLGHQGMLSEARELAQKSLIATDKITDERLLRYRYRAIVTELGHDPERTLNWLRDTALLNPAFLKSKHHLAAGQGIFLQAWAMLGEIPVALWGETEYAHIKHLVTATPGGAMLYIYYLRTPLLDFAATHKDPPPLVARLEKYLATARLLYTHIAEPLAQLAKLPATLPWTIRTRYARALATVAPTPGFDHVLLHIALDGYSIVPGFPGPQLRVALGDNNVSYWSLWAGCLSPERETRLSHLMPAAETLEDHELLQELNQLLPSLRQLEQKLVKPGWNEILPWMPRWQLDHLLALGIGSNKPRNRFSPSLPPYSTYYRRWSEPVPVGTLPSDLIAENARNGGFASLFEVLAALEGGARLVIDPVHGLIPAQKRALAAARKANPKKFGNLNYDTPSSPVMRMLFLAALLAGGVGAAVRLTENIGQAIGLSLVIAGFIGILAVQMAKPRHA